MSKKYKSAEHQIRDILEGKLDVLTGAGKFGHTLDDVLKAIRNGEKVSDDVLNSFSKGDQRTIRYEMQKSSALPKEKPPEPTPEPAPEAPPAPEPVPEKPANDPNPPGVTPIREPAAPTPVEPYKVPEWNPKETPKPANDPVAPSAPVPEAPPAPAPRTAPAPDASPAQAPRTAPAVSPAQAPALKAAPDVSPRLAPRASPKETTKGPARTRFIPPLGGSTPGQEIGIGAGGVYGLPSVTHVAGERRVFEENEADKARSEIVNVPRPNAKDAKVNRTRQNEILKKIHEENMAKKNIILRAIKEKKTPPSVELNPKLKDKDPGGDS